MANSDNRRILVYKRTHIGDPDPKTKVFGNNDCMGGVRGYKFDAVIGVGGIGAKPKRDAIDRRITWIGLEPRKRLVPRKKGPEVRFRACSVWDAKGPELQPWAPALAKRLFDGGARFLLLTGLGADAPLHREASKILAAYERGRITGLGTESGPPVRGGGRARRANSCRP